MKDPIKEPEHVLDEFYYCTRCGASAEAIAEGQRPETCIEDANNIVSFGTIKARRKWYPILRQVMAALKAREHADG